MKWVSSRGFFPLTFSKFPKNLMSTTCPKHWTSISSSWNTQMVFVLMWPNWPSYSPCIFCSGSVFYFSLHSWKLSCFRKSYVTGWNSSLSPLFCSKGHKPLPLTLPLPFLCYVTPAKSFPLFLSGITQKVWVSSRWCNLLGRTVSLLLLILVSTFTKNF